MSYVILNQNLDVCGVLDLNGRGCKFYDDLRSTKIADEQGKIWSDTLEINVPYGYDETDYITQGHHLLKEANDGYTYCYRIYNWIDSAVGTTHVKKALGLNLIAWDLTHKIIPPAKFNLANSQDIFEYILQGSGWEINHNGFFGDSKPVEFNAGQNAMYWLDQQIANFNVEIRAYVQVYNGKIIRKLVDIVEELGESDGYRLEYEHDLIGLARSGDDSQLYTKLYVYGGTDKDNNPISIASVNGGKDFIIDDDANDTYNNGDALYLEGYVTNQDLTNPGALLDWGKAQLKKFNHPRHTYGVDVAYLGYMPNLGDHFQVVDFSMSPELTVSARTIQLDESEANPTANKVTIGEFVDVIVVTPSDIRSMQAKAEAAQAALEKAIALKNTFFRQDEEPTTATEGDFWIYTGADVAIPPVQQFKNGVWVEANELKGEQGIQGQKGADGLSTYLHIAYADDASGNGFSQTPGTKAYMGTYVDNIQNDSTDRTKYTWVKIQGVQGPQGPTGLQGAQGPNGNQGIKGDTGANGLSSYTHIAYATNSTGTAGFSISDSTGKTYIGMYVDNTVTDSSDPSKYKWSLIKGLDGAQGIPGPSGANGQTTYLHIAYATNNTGTADFSISDPAGKTHMGTYTDFTSADSLDPSKYTWSLIQGPQGIQGPAGLQGIQGPKGDTGIQGPVGANGVSSYTHIAYATSADGSQGFSTSVSTGKTYIGMYVDTIAADSTDYTKYKWSLIKGADGAQGIQGPVGANGQTPYLHIAYANNATGSSGFSTTDATDRTYIGTYTDFIQNDSTDPTKYTWALIQGPQGIQGPAGIQGVQGIQGPKGDQGIQGPVGANGTSSYTHIAYANNSTGTVGFSVSDPTGKSYIGMYVDTTATDSTDPTKYKWSQIKGLDGAQGVQGPAGSNGQTPYLHIAYSTSPTGSTGFNTSDPTNATYIGTYTDFTAADSIVPSDYTWAKFQGPTGPQGATGTQGLQGLQGPQGNQGIQGPAGSNSYTHIAYSTSATGNTGFSLSDPTGKTYIGMYVDNNATDSTDPTKYKWSLIKGADGAQGIQGPTGSNGQTSYLHIAYATNSTGTAGFSTTDATGKTYIGTYTDFTAADSNTPSMYTWALMQGPQGPTGNTGAQGPQGIQGPSGANGQSLYTWVKYGTSITGAGITDDPTGMTYIGLAYNKTVATESSLATDYSWSLIQGPTGPQGSQGIQGPNGSNGQSLYTWIKYADDINGTNMTDDPTGKKYMGIAYNKSSSTESTAAVDYSWSLVQGPQGATGNTGATGKGITSITEYYLATSASSGVTTATAGWTTTVQTVTTTNKYLWNYEKVTYTDASTVNTTPVIIGVYGDTGAQGPQGSQGIQGPSGSNGQSLYTWIKYGTSAAGAGINDSPVGMTYIGVAYNKSVATESNIPTDYEWSLIQGPTGPQGVQGNQGIQGPTGANGQPTYTWIKYADDASGTNMADSPVGKKYMGIAYNKTTQTESAITTDYEWSLIQGPTGNTGATGKGITSVTEYYLATTVSTGVTTGTTGWTTTMQSLTNTNKYLWNYEKVTYTDASTVNTTPVVIGVYGDTGLQGAQGNQGIQGPVGPSGQTTYTWVKYADDQYGGNMNDSPTGKRYLGLAYNKTTATESNVAGDYQWSPLYDNVSIGDRNFILNSYYDWIQDGALATTYYPPSPDGTLSISNELVGELNRNGKLVLMMSYKTTNVVWGTTNPWAGYELTITYSDASKAYWDCGGAKSLQVNTPDFVKQVNFYQVAAGKTVSSVTISPLVRDLTGTVEMRQFKVGVGTIETTWSPAPEDIQGSIDTKAADSDLDGLSNAISLINSGLNGKTDAGDFGALKDAYDAYVIQNGIDAKAVSDSLATMDGRVALAETIAGDSKIVTDFINTVITESEEGIYIANNSSSTGILIASDRISFMDNNVEVAYINNQTMQINHGIFVQSAVIANFNFELIPGTTILSIAWVGD